MELLGNVRATGKWYFGATHRVKLSTMYVIYMYYDILGWQLSDFVIRW